MNFSYLKNISLKIFQSKKMDQSVEALNKMDKKFFSDKFDKFYGLEDYIFCLNLIEENYIPKKSQQEAFNKTLHEKIKNKEINYDQIKDFKKLPFVYKTIAFINVKNKTDADWKTVLGFFDKDNNKVQWIEHFEKSMSSFNNYYKKGLSEYGCFNKYKTEDVNKNVYYILNLLDFNNKLILEKKLPGNMVKRVKESLEIILKSVVKDKNIISSPIEYAKKDICYDKLESNFNVLKQKLIDCDDNQQEKSNILLQLKSLKVMDEKFEVTNEYSTKDLPEVSQHKILELNETVKSLNNQESYELYEKTLKSIVKKFLNIDIEYRSSLKNIQGLDAEQLMNDSLDDLNVFFSSKLQNTNQEKLSDLSVESRKVKMM